MDKFFRLKCLFVTLLLLLLPIEASAQKLFFHGGKSFDIDSLRKKFKTITVEVWNYDLRSFEKYNAFNFKDILDSAYGEGRWVDNFALKSHTLDSYTPLIEMYKFEQRFPYLAFERTDSSRFTTVQGHKDKVIKLSPFYLIWREDYKKNAAKRRDHWPFKITGFELVQNPPISIIPEPKASKAIMWGYKNYLKQCIACHSINNIGGENGGKMFQDVAIDKKSDQFLHKYISNSKAFGKTNIMPPFPRKINKRTTRIKNIVKYLRYIQNRDFKNFGKNLGKKKRSRYSELLKTLSEIRD